MVGIDSDYDPLTDKDELPQLDLNPRDGTEIPHTSDGNRVMSEKNGQNFGFPTGDLKFGQDGRSNDVLTQLSAPNGSAMEGLFPPPLSFMNGHNPVGSEGTNKGPDYGLGKKADSGSNSATNDPDRLEEGAMDMFIYVPQSMQDSKKESLAESKLIKSHRMVQMFPFTRSFSEEGLGKDFSKSRDFGRDFMKKDMKIRHSLHRKPSEASDSFKGITTSIEVREMCQIEAWKKLIQSNKNMFKPNEIQRKDSIESLDDTSELIVDKPEKVESENVDTDKKNELDKKKLTRDMEMSWALNRFTDLPDSDELVIDLKLFTEDDLKDRELNELKISLEKLSNYETKVYPYQMYNYPSKISKTTTNNDSFWMTDSDYESGEKELDSNEKGNDQVTSQKEEGIEGDLEDELMDTEFNEIKNEINEEGQMQKQMENKEDNFEDELEYELEKELELDNESDELNNLENELENELLNNATQLTISSARDTINQNEEDEYKTFGELEELEERLNLYDYNYKWYKYRKEIGNNLTLSNFVEFEHSLKSKYNINGSEWMEEEGGNEGLFLKLYSVSETNLKLLMHYKHPEVANIVNSQIYDLNSSNILYKYTHEEEETALKDELLMALEDPASLGSNASVVGGGSAVGVNTARDGGSAVGSDKEGKESKDTKESKDAKETKEGKESKEGKKKDSKDGAKELEKELDKDNIKDEDTLLVGKESDVRRQWRKRLQGIDKQKRLKLVNQGVSLSCLDSESIIETTRNYDFVFEFEEVSSMLKAADYIGILNHSFDAHYASSNPHDVGREDEILNKRDLIHTRVARNLVGVLPIVGKSAKIHLARFHRLDFRTGLFTMSVTYYLNTMAMSKRRKRYLERTGEIKYEYGLTTAASQLVSQDTNTVRSQQPPTLGSQIEGTQPEYTLGSQQLTPLEFQSVDALDFQSVDTLLSQALNRQATQESNIYTPPQDVQMVKREVPPASSAFVQTSQADYSSQKSSMGKDREEDEEEEGVGITWEVYPVVKSIINLNFKDDDLIDGVQNHCSNYFVNSSDLSLVDDTKVVLLEYIEKHPLLLNNIGMASRVDTYINSNSGESIFTQDNQDKKEEVLGNITYTSEYELFGVTHRLKNNDMQSILENTLYKAPIFYRTSHSSHYSATGSSNTSVVNGIGGNAIITNTATATGDLDNATHTETTTHNHNGTTDTQTAKDHEATTTSNADVNIKTETIHENGTNDNFYDLTSTSTTKNSVLGYGNTFGGLPNNDTVFEERANRNKRPRMYDFLLVRTKVGGNAQNKVANMNTSYNANANAGGDKGGHEIMRIRSLDDNLVLGVVGQCEPKVLINNPKSKSYLDENKLLLKAWVIKMAMMNPGSDLKRLRKLARKKFYPLIPEKEITSVLKQIEATPIFSTRPQALENTVQATIKPEVVCSLESARAQRFRLKARGITHLKSHDGMATVSSILSQQESHFENSISQAKQKLSELRKAYYTRMVTLNVDEKIIKEKIRYFNVPISEYTLYGHPPFSGTELEDKSESNATKDSNNRSEDSSTAYRNNMGSKADSELGGSLSDKYGIRGGEGDKKSLGATKLERGLDKKIRNIIAIERTNRSNRGNISSKVEYIERLLKLSNWNITHDVKMVLKGNGQFSLHGMGDPSNSGLALSLIKRQVNTANNASTTGNIYNISIVGQSNEDLRKLSMEELAKRLQLYGVSDAIIRTLPRWDQVALVRQYRDGYGAAKNVDDPGNKFRIPPQEYKNQLAKVIQKQREALAQPVKTSPLSMNELNSFKSVINRDEVNYMEVLGPEGDVMGQKHEYRPEETFDDVDKELEELKLLKESLNLKRNLDLVIEDDKLIPVPGLMWLRQSRKTPSEPFGNERAVFIYGEKNIAKVLKWRRECAERNKTTFPSEAMLGINIGKRMCRNCGQPGHISSNPKCPLYAGEKLKHEPAYLKQQGKKQEPEVETSEDELITKPAAMMKDTKQYIKSNLTTYKSAESDTELSDVQMYTDPSTQPGADSKTKGGVSLGSKRRKTTTDGKEESVAKGISNTDLKIINKILVSIEKESRYRPFMSRIPEAIAPNYYKIIKHPMWLSLLKLRVKTKYYTDVSKLMNDIFLLEINCKMYNTEQSQNAWLRKMSQVLVDDLINRIKHHIQNKAQVETVKQLHINHINNYRNQLTQVSQLTDMNRASQLKDINQMTQMTDMNSQMTEMNLNSQFSMDSQLTTNSQYAGMGLTTSEINGLNRAGLSNQAEMMDMGSIGTVASMGKEDTSIGSMANLGGMSSIGNIATMDGMTPMDNLGGMSGQSGGMAHYGVSMNQQGMDQSSMSNMGDLNQFNTNFGQFEANLAQFGSDMAQFGAEIGQYGTEMGDQYILNENGDMVKIELSEYANLADDPNLNYGLAEEMANVDQDTLDNMMGVNNAMDELMGMDNTMDEMMGVDHSLATSADNSVVNSVVNDQDDSSAVNSSVENNSVSVDNSVVNMDNNSVATSVDDSLGVAYTFTDITVIDEREDETPEDSFQREEVIQSDYPYYNEWAEQMGDFHPKSLLNVIVDAKSTEIFYENVAKQPTTIKGMFYTQSKDDYLGVHVMVKSPINEVLYSKDAPEGFFSLEAKMVGNYEISLTNTHWMTPVYVTFASGTDDHSILKSEHVENTFNRVKKLEEHIDNIYSQFRYFWTHNNRQMIATKKAQGRLLLYALLQFSIILICSLVCFWYVKKSVSNKRIL